MKRLIILLAIFGMSVTLIACGNAANNDNNNNQAAIEDPAEMEQLSPEDLEVTEEELIAEDKVVMTVNGIDLIGEKYNEVYSQIKVTMGLQGIDVRDHDVVQEQVIEVMIEREIISQDAKEVGIDVSDEDISEEFALIKEENEEQLAAVLEQYKITEDEYKDQIAFDLMLEKYISSEIGDIDISDEELEETYEGIKEQQEAAEQEVPELDDIRDDLLAQMTEQKEMDELVKKIEGLREKADIDTKI